MELRLWFLFGLAVTSAAGKRAGRRAAPGASAHKRTPGRAGRGGGRGEGGTAGRGLWPRLATPAGARGAGWGAEAEGTDPRGLGRLQPTRRLETRGPGRTLSVFREVGNFSKSLQTIQKLCKMTARFSESLHNACTFSAGTDSLRAARREELPSFSPSVHATCKPFGSGAPSFAHFSEPRA